MKRKIGGDNARAVLGNFMASSSNYLIEEELFESFQNRELESNSLNQDDDLLQTDRFLSDFSMQFGPLYETNHISGNHPPAFLAKHLILSRTC